MPFDVEIEGSPFCKRETGSMVIRALVVYAKEIKRVFFVAALRTIRRLIFFAAATRGDAGSCVATVSGVPSTDPLMHGARASRVAAALLGCTPSTYTTPMKSMFSNIVGGVVKLKKSEPRKELLAK